MAGMLLSTHTQLTLTYPDLHQIPQWKTGHVNLTVSGASIHKVDVGLSLSSGHDNIDTLEN